MCSIPQLHSIVFSILEQGLGKGAKNSPQSLLRLRRPPPPLQQTFGILIDFLGHFGPFFTHLKCFFSQFCQFCIFLARLQRVKTSSANLAMKMASNQKMQENKLASKFNFTQEGTPPKTFSDLFFCHRTLPCIAHLQLYSIYSWGFLAAGRSPVLGQVELIPERRTASAGRRQVRGARTLNLYSHHRI